MSGPRLTCHGCPNLKHQEIMRAQVAHCAVTGFVIPHHFKSDPLEVTYWRVPMACPLPDTEVVKSEDKAPRQHWVTVTEVQS